jgi:hypothetical protein
MTASALKLKAMADELDERDARELLRLARKLARERRRAEEDRRDAEDARKALAEPGSTRWGDFKAARGL